MSGNREQPAPVKPQGYGLETQTELPEYSPSYGATKLDAGLSVHTQPGGKGPLKGAGLQVSGTVEGVEHRDGLTTIRYQSGGRVEAVSFPQHKHDEHGHEMANPLNAVADALKEGDHFGLRIGREGSAVLANTSEGVETRIQPSGQTDTRPIDLSRQQTQDRGLELDRPT
jgi:hypothetical protein